MKPGTVVRDRYTVESEVGRGHHAVVYRAQDRRLGSPVALKVVDGGRGTTFAIVQARAQREAAIGYDLGRETGFVSVFDWGRLDATRLYLAMDLIEGAPLDLHAGSLEERMTRLQRAAGLVARVHARRVVHRDLKPSNFLLDGRGRLHMIDFGLAKTLGEDDYAPETLKQLTQANTALGTCVFMPPEQYEDASTADVRCDVYALGVMLFLALTGRYPYPGKSGVAVFEQLVHVRHGRLEPARPKAHVPGLPDEVDVLCAQALAVDPAKRTPSAEAFVEGLELALAGDPAPIPKTSPAVEIERREEPEKPVTPWQRFLRDKG